MSKKVVKVRVTTHRGRTGKNGAYNPKHNDRNFDASRSKHIDISRSDKNVYWHYYKKTHPNMTFEEAEKKFYSEHFSDALDQKNDRYIRIFTTIEGWNAENSTNSVLGSNIARRSEVSVPSPSFSFLQ